MVKMEARLNDRHVCARVCVLFAENSKELNVMVNDLQTVSETVNEIKSKYSFHL